MFVFKDFKSLRNAMLPRVHRVVGLDAQYSPRKAPITERFVPFRDWFYIFGMKPPRELPRPRIHSLDGRVEPISPLIPKDGEINKVIPWKRNQRHRLYDIKKIDKRGSFVFKPQPKRVCG